MEDPVSIGVARGRRLSASDWIRVATEALVEGGVAAVAVEPLALRLGATKGSFYHHFENREALIQAALEEWERSQTEAVIQRLQLIADPAERLRAVLTAAFGDRPGGVRDAALLSAATDAMVRPVVARVTRRRTNYFAEAFMQLGMTRAQARRRALLLYTAYLGLFEQLRTGVGGTDTDAELRAYVTEALDALIPSPPQSRSRTRRAGR